MFHSIRIQTNMVTEGQIYSILRNIKQAKKSEKDQTGHPTEK